jgi:hypothetical protein
MKPFVFSMLALFIPFDASAVAEDDLSGDLIFHASFDGQFDADVGVDKRIRTANTHERAKIELGQKRQDVVIARGEGKFGDALRFQASSPETLMFSGRNMNFQPHDWSGTVSFWLRLDPDKDLPEGFSDPLLITDKKWNDASFFVDFDKELPRTLRLGTFSNYKFWNADDIAWDSVREEMRPLLPVKRPPFSAAKWTHVAFSFEHVNPSSGKQTRVVLYLDGQVVGTSQRALQMTWDPGKSAILLGINFVGDVDDFSIFRRALTAAEIKRLAESEVAAGDRK